MNAAPAPADKSHHQEAQAEALVMLETATAVFRDSANHLRDGRESTEDAAEAFYSQVLESFRKMQIPVMEEAMLKASASIRRSMAALGPAMAAVDVPTSPATASAIQATENLWRSIRDEFGLLGSTEVARLLGSRSANRSYASEQRAAGRLIGVKRGQAFVYPGFQFDRKRGRVFDVVPQLLASARNLDMDDEDLVFWLASPSGYFGGDRPVDHLDDPDDVVEKLQLSESIEW